MRFRRQTFIERLKSKAQLFRERKPVLHYLGYEPETLIVRRHEHLQRPFFNDRWSRSRHFSVHTMTMFLFIGAGYVGYAYARLRNDEVLKRQMNTRYINFMWYFTAFADWYDATYDRAI